MEIKDLDNMCVYVSEEEWKKLSPEARLELIALSKMTGQDIQETLEAENPELEKLYNKCMEFDDE